MILPNLIIDPCNVRSIELKRLLPPFQADVQSEIWQTDCVFERGRNYLLRARSGAGKSSLMSFIFGDRADYSGNLLFDDTDIRTLKGRDWKNLRTRHVSCIFQDARLFPELTVWENIAVKNRLTGYKSGEEVMQWLEMSGLGDKRDVQAGKLSFGQAQRVAIIRALCQPFDFLLADEPFSHLDEETIGSMVSLMAQEVQNQQAGMLLCSLGLEYSFTYHQCLRL